MLYCLSKTATSRGDSLPLGVHNCELGLVVFFSGMTFYMLILTTKIYYCNLMILVNINRGVKLGSQSKKKSIIT